MKPEASSKMPEIPRSSPLGGED